MQTSRTSIILLITLLFSSLGVFSQDGNPTQAGQQNWFTYGFDNLSVSLFDKNGQPFTNPGEDVSGSPFFLPGWTYGAIHLHDSIGYTGMLLRLNLLSQQVHYQDRNKVELALPKGFIREIVLKDSSSSKGPKVYTFRCGFPPVDNQDGNNFYRVLASGKLTLLESMRKVVVSEKNELSGEQKKDIRNYDDYYLCRDSTMIRLKKDKNFILSLISDHQDQVKAFADENKLNFKSYDDIGLLITYYDGLSSR